MHTCPGDGTDAAPAAPGRGWREEEGEEGKNVQGWGERGREQEAGSEGGSTNCRWVSYRHDECLCGGFRTYTMDVCVGIVQSFGG